jgi:hypothetical protein
MSLEVDITEIKTLIEQTDKFVCNQCGQEFMTKTGYTEHITKKHSGKTYDLSNHKLGCLCSFCKDKHGENNPFFGRKHSEDTIKKQSIARKDKSYEEIYGGEDGQVMRDVRGHQMTRQQQDPAWKEKTSNSLSKALTGKPKSAAHKQKLSDVWDIGHTAEVINKMGKASRSKYMKGYFTSVMNQRDIYFQSSYELYTYICLEHDEQVQSYERCSFKVFYLFDGKMKRHVPDIEIHYKDGSIKVLEIKPAKFLTNPEITAKRLAGEKYCEEHGISYEMHTEEEIQRILDKRHLNDD